MSYYKKPDILQTPNLIHQHGLIEASAGTGKTFTIAHLVVELVLNDVPIQEILVVTFTEKAAAELKSRIRELLADLLQLKRNDERPNDVSAYWHIDDAARKKITYALEDIDLATIATIHGFCNRILSEFAFENARPYEQTQVSPDEGFRQVFGQFLQRLLADQNYANRNILTHFISNNHDYAGWLFKNIKMLTGINAAVVLPQNPEPEDPERWFRFADQFEACDLAGTIETLNINSRSRTSQAEKARAALDALQQTNRQDWLAIREWASKAVFHKRDGLHLFTKPDDIKFNKKAKEDLLQSLADLPGSVQQLLDFGQELKALADLPLEGLLLRDLMTRWQKFYEKEKSQRGWFDFDDMIDIVADRVQQESTGLRQALQSRYRYALIDECQDTDLRQWQLFSKVFLDNEEHRMYLIGDPKQAIYAFRGADVYTYLAAAEQMKAQGIQLHLDTNYRSSQPLMTAFNRIFRHESLFKPNVGITYDKDIHCGKQDLATSEGAKQAVTLFLPPQPEGDKRSFFGDFRKKALPSAMAEEIARLLNDPHFHLIKKDDAHISLSPKDIAILVNSRREADLVAEALRAQQIPFAFYKQAGLFETDEARQLYDVLEAVMFPRRDDAVFRAMMTDFFDVPLETLFEARTIPDDIRQRCLALRNLAVDKEDFYGFFDALFHDSRIFERLMLLHGDERAITNYRQLADILLSESISKDYPQLLAAFDDFRKGRMKRDDDLLRLETEREAVQIMTIHVSKGLQFPVVFVYGGFAKGGGGGQRFNFHDFYNDQKQRVADLMAQHEDAHQLERDREAERLYYVALTRAEYKLYLTHFPKAEGADLYGSFNGSYAVLRDSLEDLYQSGQVHTQTVAMNLDALPGQEPGSEDPNEVGLTKFPPLKLASAENDFYKKWISRNPVRVSSYTKLSRGNKAVKEGIEQHRQEKAGAEDEVSTTAVVDSKLRGRDFGIAIHEILEDIDHLHLREHQDLTSWQQDESARVALVTQLHPHNLADAFDTVAPLIWHAAKATIPPGLAVADIPPGDRMEEVDFFMHLEPHNKKQVFLQGSIDLVYRYQGRYYFADWKSDLLDDYAPNHLEAKVVENYRYQFLIYTEATLRWLGIQDEASYEEKFGGLLYLFVRGMDQPKHGIYFQRPTWAQTRKQRLELEQESYD